MVIYLDLLFLFNFLLNTILLYVIQLIYREKVSLVRTILGGIVGGTLIFVFLLDYYAYFFVKILGGLIVGWIGFNKDKPLNTVLKIASFYVINFTSVGIISSFNVSEWYLLIFSFIAVVIIFFIESNKKVNIFTNSLKYNISVSFNKKRFNIEGYLDTGNFSKSDDLPIIYLSKKYQSNFSVYKLIDIQTVNGITKCSSYKPTSFMIEMNKQKIYKDVLIVFVDIKDFDCLLNAELFL